MSTSNISSCIDCSISYMFLESHSNPMSKAFPKNAK